MSAHPACMCKWFGTDPDSRHMPQYECVPQSYAAVQLESSRHAAHPPRTDRQASRQADKQADR